MGARWSLVNDSIRVSTAVYEINRENILQTTGDSNEKGDDIFGNVGKVRSRGFEIDVLGDITDQWVINANYAYNDAKVVETVHGEVLPTQLVTSSQTLPCTKWAYGHAMTCLH